MIDLNKFAIDKAKEFDCSLSVISYLIEIRTIRLVEEKIPLNDLILQYTPNANKYMIESFEYRNLSANLITISSVFDQQLYNFYCILFGIPKKNNYDDLKKSFIAKKIFEPSNFLKIDTYHTIANALKHGKSSKAYKSMTTNNSIYVQQNNNFPNLKNGASFNLAILNITKNTLYDFCLAIEDFWNLLNIKVL